MARHVWRMTEEQALELAREVLEALGPAVEPGRSAADIVKAWVDAGIIELVR